LRFMLRHIQVIPLLIWFLLFSAGAYAFAQLNSTPAAPAAGLASAASGYSISHIVYALSAADPTRIGSVKFTITPSSANARIATVRAKLISLSSSYSACVNISAGSQAWVCPISGVTVAAADQLMLDVNELPVGPGFHLFVPAVRR
jgi:hypothetical protein